MAEESFIVLENSPSLMEPYSFLEMPDSVSLVSSAACSAIESASAAIVLTPTVDDSATANTTKTNIDENALLKSIWSTQAVTNSTNTIVTTTNTQTLNDETRMIQLWSLFGLDPQNPLSIEPTEQLKQSAIVAQGASDQSINGYNASIEMPQSNENTGQQMKKIDETVATQSFASISTSSGASSLKSTKETSMDATKKSMATSLSTTPKDKLAESFLLGNIDYETMKSNVLSHFPSLITCGDATTKDKTEQPLPDLSSTIVINDSVPWNGEILEEAPQVVKKCQNEIEELNRQNVELQYKIVELQQLVENRHLVQIDEIDGVSQNCTNDEATITESVVAEISKQHEQQIQTMQFELSKAIGENMEFEDMKKSYIDEIDCLKVNLVATEELYKENVAQTNILKSRNLFLSQEITDNRKQIATMQTDVDLLKAQLEQYKKDFEAEKTLRQELSNEREHILTDLQHALAATGSSFSSVESQLIEQPVHLAEELRAIPQYSCPVCAAIFDNFQLLEIHVDRCLDRLEQSSH